MQILTCRVGDIVWVEGGICVAPQSRSRQRITVSVLAPANVELVFGGTVLRPSVLPSGTHSYLFSLMSVRHFRIGGIELRAWLPGDAVPAAANFLDHLHLGVIAPGPCQIRHDRANAENAIEWGGTPLSPLARGFAC